jgi:hypothetical protein
MFELKPLSVPAIAGALAKAERYRLLNEPEQAVSICEDILAVDPDHVEARKVLILALTDTFPHDTPMSGSRAQALAAQLPTEYERTYFAGLIAERRARALLGRGGIGRRKPAGAWLREALHAYERAQELRPPENDDALLRWNACARLINAHPDLESGDDGRPPDYPD